MPTPPARSPREATSLTIVLPAYNEAKRIGPALDELTAWLRGTHRENLPREVDVLLVDDGSTDGTAELVERRADPHLRVLRVPHAGKGAAVRAGILHSTSDLVIFADADMATPPAELPKLVFALRTADVALGSRIQPDGSDMRATQPRYRRMLGGMFHALASLWVVGEVKDTQCGFKGFTREAAQGIFSRQKVTSIVFDVELIHLARRLRYKVAIVPIRWEDVRGSRMRPGARLALRVAWDLFRIPLLHRDVKQRA
jgi:dolichyl-phosphate beta-glucosyltransferase